MEDETIMRAIENGETAVAISSLMGISKNKVRGRISHLKHKFGVSSTSKNDVRSETKRNNYAPIPSPNAKVKNNVYQMLQENLAKYPPSQQYRSSQSYRIPISDEDNSEAEEEEEDVSIDTEPPPSPPLLPKRREKTILKDNQDAFSASNNSFSESNSSSSKQTSTPSAPISLPKTTPQFNLVTRGLLHTVIELPPFHEVVAIIFKSTGVQVKCTASEDCMKLKITFVSCLQDDIVHKLSTLIGLPKELLNSASNEFIGDVVIDLHNKVNPHGKKIFKSDNCIVLVFPFSNNIGSDEFI